MYWQTAADYMYRHFGTSRLQGASRLVFGSRLGSLAHTHANARPKISVVHLANLTCTAADRVHSPPLIVVWAFQIEIELDLVIFILLYPWPVNTKHPGGLPLSSVHVSTTFEVVGFSASAAAATSHSATVGMIAPPASRQEVLTRSDLKYPSTRARPNKSAVPISRLWVPAERCEHEVISAGSL